MPSKLRLDAVGKRLLTLTVAIDFSRLSRIKMMILLPFSIVMVVFEVFFLPITRMMTFTLSELNLATKKIGFIFC